MSQPAPPPQPQPTDGNPYAQQPGPQAGNPYLPGNSPYGGAPGPQGGNPYGGAPHSGQGSPGQPGPQGPGPQGGNPYAGAPGTPPPLAPAAGAPIAPGTPGAPVSPYLGQAPDSYAAFPNTQAPGGYPVAGPDTDFENSTGLGLACAVVAALVAAAVYGAIIGLTKHEIGWAAVGVGFVVGLAAGKVGGRNPLLPVVSAVLSLGAVYLGQMVGEAMIGAKQVGVGFTELFFQHFGLVHDAWKSDADPLTFLFFALAAFAAFSSAKKASF